MRNLWKRYKAHVRDSYVGKQWRERIGDKSKFKQLTKWQKAALVVIDVVLLAFVTGLDAMQRGYEYLRGDVGSGAASQFVEGTYSLQFWGWGFLVAGSVLLLGVVGQLHFSVCAGHMLCFAMYAILWLTLVISAAQTGSGFRTSGDVGTIALLHLLYGIRTGLFPIDSKKAKPVAIVQEAGTK